MDIRTYKPLPVIDDPRQYQVEILNLAIQKNVIAYLGTGTGKTLIAILLIKHVFENERKNQLQDGTTTTLRKSFFLVTTVPLVFQQAGVIQSNLTTRVGKYCGEMGVDYWNAKKWTEELEKHDVIVCTAKIMENLLHLAYITIDKVNLIIFDECHNTVGNSPYSSIMKNFYFTTPREKRPKILGLTASPINSGIEYNTAKINTILTKLERALDSQVVTVNSSEELLKYLSLSLIKFDLFCLYMPQWLKRTCASTLLVQLP